MYSHPVRAPWIKSILISIMIMAMVFTATPKQSDGIILLIVAASVAAPLAIGAVIAIVVADIVLICVLGGLGCGGGDGSGSLGSGSGSLGSGLCDAAEGNPCSGPNSSCPSQSLTGVLGCDGISCIIDPSSLPSCTSSANYCSMTNSGNSSCGTCDAVTPPDTDCAGIPLTDDSLILTPWLVRKGDDVTISWNLNMNFPTNCTLTGSNLSGFAFTDTTPNEGSVMVTVSGPHRYALECMGDSIIKDLKVLPALYES